MFFLSKPLFCPVGKPEILESSYFFSSVILLVLISILLFSLCHLYCLVQSNLLNIKLSIKFLPKLIGSYITPAQNSLIVNKVRSPEHSFQDCHDLAQLCVPVSSLTHVLYLSVLLTLMPRTSYAFSRHCFCSCDEHRGGHTLSAFSAVCQLAARPLVTAPELLSRKPHLVVLSRNESSCLLVSTALCTFMIVFTSFCPEIIVFCLPAPLDCKPLEK